MKKPNWLKMLIALKNRFCPFRCCEKSSSSSSDEDSYYGCLEFVYPLRGKGVKPIGAEHLSAIKDEGKITVSPE